MRRLLFTSAAVCAAAAGVLSMTGAGDTGAFAGRYTVELDDAFGLIEGADVKVAGVRAGKIKAMRVDRTDMRALIDIEITKRGFDSLREDVFCESRPQSLIGEYFIDCLPGKSPKKLPAGSTIPVEKTGSTVSVDLVNNIYRRPYRERFTILLQEFGAGLAARGGDLNETIRRASPALRETDKVLRQLAEQRAAIRDLADDADEVVGKLADKRKDVVRFVREARDTARVSAANGDAVRRQFQQFPGFLRELQPTMKLLEDAARHQTPALVTLRAQAPALERLFKTLKPYALASRPSFVSLGEAAERGRGAARELTPRARELASFAKEAPELATNLAIVLEHLDDQDFAVEKDPRAPGGDKGFSGLQALLQYVFRQQQATNIYDANGYILKVTVFADQTCSPYATAEEAKAPEAKRCIAQLGPNLPGINQPDPTDTPEAAARERKARKRVEEGRSVAPAPLVQEALGKAPATPGIDLRSLQLLDYLLSP